MNNRTAPTMIEMAEHMLNECVDKAYRRSAVNLPIWTLLDEAVTCLCGCDDEGVTMPFRADIPRAAELLSSAASLTLEPAPLVVISKGRDQEARQRQAQFSAENERGRLRLEVHAVLYMLERVHAVPPRPDADKLAAAADAAEALARVLRAASAS